VGGGISSKTLLHRIHTIKGTVTGYFNQTPIRTDKK